MTQKTLLLTVTGVSTLGDVGAGVLLNKNNQAMLKNYLVSKGNSSSVQITGGKRINKIPNLIIQEPESGSEVDFASLKNECKALFNMKFDNNESFNNAKNDAL